MYSLVSASVLALDLARHPSGAAVADVVDRVLALTPGDLVALGAHGARPELDEVRARVREACGTRPRMTAALGGLVDLVTAAPEGRLPAPVLTRGALEVMAASLLGDLDGLVDLLVREEPLRSTTPAARQAALDAVVVAWAGRLPEVDLGELARLRAPWAAALGPLPLPLDDAALGPQGPAVRALLERVSRTGAVRWDEVAAAQGAAEDPLGWSTAMHEASRAAWESGRLVAVARAQLALARALRLSGVSASRAASGAGLAASAAVQATCVADVLDPDAARALLGPWEAGATA